MKKLMFVFGTRPEAIKLAPVIREWGDEAVIVNTGQHTDILDLLDIPRDYELGVSKYADKDMASQIAYMIGEISNIVRFQKPDSVVVQGDTTSALAGALSAFYSKVKLTHVEAGLRTWCKQEPYPEEANRKIIDYLADVLFAPTYSDYINLRNEGVGKNNIYVVGNTVVDNLNVVLETLPHIETEKLILITLHRRENADEKVRNNIFNAIEILSGMFEDFEFVYPVHPSYKYPYDRLGKIKNIQLIDPLSYLDFIKLMKRSYLIMSDSGGIQEEAPTLRKPVVVLRNYTERIDLIRCGGGFLVGNDVKEIVKRTSSLIMDNELYKNMTSIANPFGDGMASGRIVEVLRRVI